MQITIDERDYLIDEASEKQVRLLQEIKSNQMAYTRRLYDSQCVQAVGAILVRELKGLIGDPIPSEDTPEKKTKKKA